VESEGRRRRAIVLANRRRGKIGKSAADPSATDPIAFRNALRFIDLRRRSIAPPFDFAQDDGKKGT